MSGLGLGTYAGSDSESDQEDAQHKGERDIEATLIRNEAEASTSDAGFAGFGQRRRPALARKHGLPLFSKPVSGDSSDSDDVRRLDFLYLPCPLPRTFLHPD
jgi:hypothetical protein